MQTTPIIGAPADDRAQAAPPSSPATWGVVLAVLVAIAGLTLPTPDGLSPEAKHLATLFGVGLVLWVTEAIPIPVTSLLVIVLQPAFSVSTPRAAIASFMSPVFFYALAMYCIAQVVIDTGLARRIAVALLLRAGNDSRRVVLAFMVGAGLMSCVVSDLPTSAVWMSMALPLLHGIGAVSGRSSLGKALMIGIPFASLIGGVGTPVGSSINILGLFQLEQVANVQVSFLKWMAIGMPTVLLFIPLSWWIIVRCFPPEVATVGDPAELTAERDRLGPLSRAEKKMVGLFLIMLALWMLSSFYPALDSTLVAMAGTVVLFLPGVRLLTWKRAEQTIGWGSLMLIGAVISLGAASVRTGLAGYMVGALPDMQTWSPMGIVALISAFTVAVHLPLPINPVIITVMVPPIAVLATSLGHNPAMYALPVIFTTSAAFLLPLDAVTVITYSKGYYRMADMARPGIVISLLWVLWMTAMLTWVAPALGLL